MAQEIAADPGQQPHSKTATTAEKKVLRTEQIKLYQRKSRERKKATEMAEGQHDILTGKPVKQLDQPTEESPNLAVLTNSLHRKKRKDPKLRTKVNWQHQLLWPFSQEAALRTGWRARAIVRDLELRHRPTGLFRTLQRSTVQDWIAKDRCSCIGKSANRL
jgi:hypothetical protein